MTSAAIQDKHSTVGIIPKKTILQRPRKIKTQLADLHSATFGWPPIYLIIHRINFHYRFFSVVYHPKEKKLAMKVHPKKVKQGVIETANLPIVFLFTDAFTTKVLNSNFCSTPFKWLKNCESHPLPVIFFIVRQNEALIFRMHRDLPRNKIYRSLTECTTIISRRKYHFV